MEEKLIQQLQALNQQMAQMPGLIAKAVEQSRQQDLRRNMQKEYSYKSFTCTTQYPKAVTQEGETIPVRKPGTLFLYVPKHFILIDTQVLDMRQHEKGDYELLDVDSDLVVGRSIYNHHMYLPDHPFIYLASYADCTQAITAPGVYVVPDYRTTWEDDEMKEERQIVYALVCNNYNQ